MGNNWEINGWKMMPKASKTQDIHVRLSKRAAMVLEEFEEVSGFSGSRLIEEIILAIDDVMNNFISLELTMDENPSKEQRSAIFLVFISAMETVLDRIGRYEFYEEAEKDREKEKRESARTQKKESKEE